MIVSVDSLVGSLGWATSYGDFNGSKSQGNFISVSPSNTQVLIILGSVKDNMQYTKFNKTSQTLIKSIVIGGTSASEMFVDGSF
jgi:hypothetical protein